MDNLINNTSKGYIMFRVYKPKNIVRVKAVQVTTENVKELAATLLMGRVTRNEEGAVTGFAVATFDGVKNFEIGQWILRNDDNELSSMSDEEFQKAYDLARNTTIV